MVSREGSAIKDVDFSQLSGLLMKKLNAPDDISTTSLHVEAANYVLHKELKESIDLHTSLSPLSKQCNVRNARDQDFDPILTPNKEFLPLKPKSSKRV